MPAAKDGAGGSRAPRERKERRMLNQISPGSHAGLWGDSPAFGRPCGL